MHFKSFLKAVVGLGLFYNQKKKKYIYIYIYGDWRMDETHLSVFTPSQIALTESARETVSLLRLGTLSTRFFLVWSKRLYNIHVT